MLKSWNLTSHSFAPSLGSSISPKVANRPSSNEGFRLRNRRRSFRYHTKTSVKILEQRNRILRWMCRHTHISNGTHLVQSKSPSSLSSGQDVDEWVEGTFSHINRFVLDPKRTNNHECACVSNDHEKLTTPTKKVVKQKPAKIREIIF